MSVYPIIDSPWNRLNLLASRGNLSMTDWFKMMLNIGTDALGMDMGIISHIVGQDYTIQFCTHPRYSGKQYTLSQMYCDLTLQHNDLVYFKHISQTFHAQPIDDAMHVESYIGMPLYVQGQVYGTVCFVRAEPRRRDFSHEDMKFIAMLTQAVANAFHEAAV